MNVLIVNDLSWDNFAIVTKRLNPRCINPNHRINYFYGKHMQYIVNICNQNSMTLIRRPLMIENLQELIKDSLLYTKFCIIFHNFIEYNTISSFIIKICSENNVPYFIFSEHCERFYFNGEYINDEKFKTKVRNIDFIDKPIVFSVPEYLRLYCEKSCPTNIQEMLSNIRARYQCLKDEKDSKKIVLIEDLVNERKKKNKINKSTKEMNFIDFMANKKKWIKENSHKS